MLVKENTNEAEAPSGRHIFVRSRKHVAPTELNNYYLVISTNIFTPMGFLRFIIIQQVIDLLSIDAFRLQIIPFPKRVILF